MFVQSLDTPKRKVKSLFIMILSPKILCEAFSIHGRKNRETWEEWKTKQDPFFNCSAKTKDGERNPLHGEHHICNMGVTVSFDRWSMVHVILIAATSMANAIQVALSTNFHFFSSLFCIWIASFLRTWLLYGQIPEIKTKYPHNIGNRGKMIINYVQNESK